MKARAIVLVVLAFALASSACQPPAQEAGPLSEEDVAAIQAFYESYAQAIRAGEWAGAAAFYTQDAVFMPPNEPAVQGRAAIEAWSGASPPITEFSLPIGEIDGRGDLAFVRGTLLITILPEGAPEPIQDTGKYLVILRRQPDGTWLAALDIFNSDLPLPEEGSGT
jgi:ketosteroid isomerase-like protein